ncbi:MAG: family 1 glycosylhydrolase [Acidimicrobiales bacterium]
MTNLMTPSTTSEVDRSPLTPFGLGVGAQLDTAIDSTAPTPSALASLRSLGVVRYRVNVSWRSVAPAAEIIDHRVLDQLADTIELVLDAGLEPLVALDNGAVPRHLEADGGWRNQATAAAYGDFVGAVGARLGDMVEEWITLADPQPARFDASVLTVLARAQVISTNILRAHVPHARLGASVDITQLTPGPTGRAWVHHLASASARTSFVALNIDQLGTRAPAEVADAVRELDGLLPGRSFLLTETHVPVGSERLPNRLIDIEYPDRYDVVAGFFDEIRRLRADQINVNGTFAWPFTGSSAAVEGIGESSIEAYHRISMAGIN